MGDVTPARTRITEAHRRRMKAWGLPDDEDYAVEVAGRALSVPPPTLHSHAHEEMGMCLDCDAAAALAEALAELKDDNA